MEHEGATEAIETVATSEAHDAAPGAFPPFESTSFASQILWLAISFGLLYYLVSKYALPRVASILEERNSRMAGDLAEADRLKRETDAAIAAYEQALAEARGSAHGIAQGARDQSKAALEADRSRIEADLKTRLADAETRVAEVKTRTLADIDVVAAEATEAIVRELLAADVPRPEIERAVAQATGRRA